NRGTIRVKAFVVVRRPDGSMLVGENTDPTTGVLFHRPLGGSVEFGERAVDAIVREIREELGCGLVEPVLLGVIENRFSYDGEPGHDVVFVFEGALDDPDIY